MLTWFVDPSAVESSMNGFKLDSSDVKDVHLISNACRTEECPPLNRIRNYFCNAGWEKLLEIAKILTHLDWLCRICNHTLDGDQIECDGCLEWFHVACVDLKQIPKAKRWYCRCCFACVE